MADTASLVARVKTDGAEQAAKELDNFASSAASADKASDNLGNTTQKAEPKLSGLGTKAQQAGYQIQDFVVQVQSGTSVFVAFGQQASQLAGVLGPGGAVLGAVIALGSAIGGTLYKSLGDAEISTKDLSEAQKNLQQVLERTASGAYRASDALRQLILSGANAAVVQAKVGAASDASAKQLKGMQQAAQAAAKAGDTLWYGNAIGAENSLKTGAAVDSLNGYLEKTADKLGVTRDQAKTLVPLLAAVQQNASGENIAALGKALDGLAKPLGKQSSGFVELNSAVQGANQAVVENGNIQKSLTTIVEDTNKKNVASNDLYIRSLEVRGAKGKEQAALERDLLKAQIKEREGLSDAERSRANAAADKQYETEVAKIDEQEKKKTDRQDKAAQRREESKAKRDAAALAREQKQGDAFLDLVQRSSTDRLKVIEATETQRLEKAKELNEQGAITQKEYEDAKTQIVLEADTARQEELDKRKKAQLEKDNKGDNFLAQIMGQNATELELYDIQQKQKEEVAKQYRDQGLISEEEYQRSLVAIAGNYNKKRSTEYSAMLGETTDNLRTALGEGNKMYKAFAIANAIMNTYQGAVAAFQSAAAIPIVGWVAAPIAAAAAVAAGLANVAKIRSAREQGGNLSAGQMSTIAERGQPEVIMPAGASRVRTAAQMRQIMGDNGQSNNGTPNIQIVNQTTGRIDSATTEQMDEGKLRLIIRETVSSDMADSNSSISKTRRATRTQPGFR